nr:unnamed protein product [Callosobruchus chinensis]
MTERRFALLCKFLHFSNNNENAPQDKLFKVRPVLDHLKKKFMEVYVPEQNISIDESLLDKGYCLFLDNYYTSVDLAEKLSQRRTDCVGTMRINRKGVPKDLKEKKLARGDTFALFRKKLMLLKYKDKKEIIMISSLHDNQFVEKTKRGKVIKKPAVVEQYNQKMGGVDLTENMLHFMQ